MAFFIYSQLYWIHSRSVDTPKIYRCHYDSSYPEVIVESDLYHPTSLTIDYTSSIKRLYWIDLGTKTISTSRIDGTHRHDLEFNTKGPINPIAVAIYSKFILWADYNGRAIYKSYKLPKSPSYAQPQLMFDHLDDLTGISVMKNTDKFGKFIKLYNITNIKSTHQIMRVKMGIKQTNVDHF